MNKYVLANGVKMPAVGLGTWQITDREVLRQTLNKAFEIGYRMIDTAAAYCNEMAIGKVLQECEILREELFIADKLWNTNRGYTESQEACKKSLKKLKVDYLDAYLLHWPATSKMYKNWKEINAETWRGLETLYKEGLVRSIGVCNFKVCHLEALKETANVMPMLNQLELHPGMLPEDILQYCRENKIQIEASSPLGNGQILNNETLLKIAKVKKMTTAQICLRWAIEKNAAVIPKTTSEERLRQNLDVFGFGLSMEETEEIDKLPYYGGIWDDWDGGIRLE